MNLDLGVRMVGSRFWF